MKNIATLQRIVNDISREIGRIDSIEKLAVADKMANEIVKDHALMAEILHEALAIRFQKDLDYTTRQFLRQAGANL